jgi:DDE family transposase
MKVAMKVVSGPCPTHDEALLTRPNESYLIGRVHSDAKRATKIGDHVWRGGAHTLRRCLPAASLPDSYRLQSSSCQRSNPDPTQQALHHWRVIARNPVPDHSWSRTNRDYTALATQWSVSVLERTADLPRGPTTLRRFLLRMAPQALTRLRKLHDRFLARMITKPHLPSRLIFDLDSTVLVVYGKQQGAEVGYNPTKHGRRSYHPLLCFEGQTKDFWHGELRPGNVHTSSGTLDLLKACFAKSPSEIKSVIIRADKGFYDHKIIEWLEARKARFVIVARLTRPVKHKLAHLKYVSVSAGVQAAEFSYQPIRWSHSYRFVVIRRPQPEEPDPQLRLFKLGKYHYQVLVTNLDLRPLNLWRFYNGRAGIERIIRELKGDYPLGKIPTRHFLANEAYLHLLLLAYNLVNWFKRLCLPPDFQTATLDTLRNRILLMPAQLLRTGNRPRLAMPAAGNRENAWKHALHKIEKLRL